MSLFGENGVVSLRSDLIQPCNVGNTASWKSAEKMWESKPLPHVCFPKHNRFLILGFRDSPMPTFMRRVEIVKLLSSRIFSHITLYWSSVRRLVFLLTTLWLQVDKPRVSKDWSLYYSQWCLELCCDLLGNILSWSGRRLREIVRSLTYNFLFFRFRDNVALNLLVSYW